MLSEGTELGIIQLSRLFLLYHFWGDWWELRARFRWPNGGLVLFQQLLLC